jgi:hypothetical protein
MLLGEARGLRSLATSMANVARMITGWPDRRVGGFVLSPAGGPGTPARMRFRSFLLFVGCSLAASCAPPWRQAYLRGEEAVASARYDDAAIAFTESCEVDADASDACVRASTLRRGAVETALRAAAPFCANDLVPCLDRLRTARSLAVYERSLGEKVEALLDDTSARHVQRCMQARERHTIEAAMVAARCVTAHEDNVGTQAHRRRVDEALALIAQELDPQKTEPIALRAVRAGLALCYAPTAVRTTAVSHAFAAVVKRHRARLSVGPLEGVPSSFVDVLCQTAGMRRGAMDCDAGGGPVVLVDARLDRGRVEHTTRDTEKSVQYVARVDEQPNPDFARVRERVADLQDEVRRAADRKDAATVDCRSAEVALREAGYCYDCNERSARERMCQQQDSAERAMRDVESQLGDEERRLRNTDEVLRIPRYAAFDFVETRHTWELPVRLDARCRESSGTFAVPSLSVTRTVRFFDDTHIGFSKARLAEDPLNEPTGTMFDEETLATARTELVAFVDRCVEAFADDGSRCEGAIDCTQRRALYRGEDPITAAIAALSASIDQANPGLPRSRCRGS